MIDDFLNLHRVTRKTLEPVPVDLGQMAREIAHELQVGDRERRVVFLIPPVVKAHGDPDLLRIALGNLLGNAWKFTRSCARGVIEFGSTVREGEVVYFVRDNGAGFDMAFVAKLFRPFERLHSPQEYPGTGVGLATVQRVIERHGGRVWAEGGVDRGATFFFTLRP